MKDNLKRRNTIKGELNMKKTFLVLALAVALVLSFSALAGANEWKGFSPLNPAPADGMPGFVNWNDAVDLMNANGVPAALQATVHGGYVTSTTKCAVCHSLHRATGIPTGTPAPNNQLFLTAADGGSCTVCHTDWGSGFSNLLVEWATNGVGAGPHNTVGACGACHGGGIHGGNGSEFHVMNVFMLGGVADAQIQAEFNSGPQGRGTGSTWDPSWASRNVFTSPANLTVNANASWWALGTTSPGAMGAIPGTLTPLQFAAARSVATGATCGRAGCHTFGAFANNVWGSGFDRTSPDGIGTIQVTGHAVPALGTTSGTTNGGCGPCHPGNAAGFPTFTRNTQWRQFGCNQCHDMVGAATNSIAFPHGNRNIDVFEWAEVAGQAGQNAFTAVELNSAPAGNLWMYSGNIARRAGAAASTVVGDVSGFASTEWRVMTGVTSGEFVPGTTGLQDGACLKCHVAGDALSLNNTGVGAFIGPQGFGDVATRAHGWTAGNAPPSVGGNANPAVWGQTQAIGSFRIHLYR